ncbi:MAG: Cell envelope biosis protein OmpA [Pseudomonadota bacterium]|jgi:outer membrane protein OmpA-like peptidoglycan-associated protein|nr:Cell envelope biosis protein OmpA [Pseudomonadota bacterium]
MHTQRTIKLTALVLGASLVLAGCQTTDPYTGEQKTSNTTKGAAIGAGVGVAIGLLTGDSSSERKKRALILGGAGGLAGGAVGNYMDRQEAKLRTQLQGTGVSVTRSGDNIILNMPGNVTFMTNSADINASFYQVLTSVALVLKEFDKTVVDIAGHADSSGPDDKNLELSQRRAGSVSGYLAGQGINPQRLIATGYGETRPIASNDTAEGRAQNRRVEITLLPVTQ